MDAAPVNMVWILIEPERNCLVCLSAKMKSLRVWSVSSTVSWPQSLLQSQSFATFRRNIDLLVLAHLGA